jgi:hypothetical protein
LASASVAGFQDAFSSLVQSLYPSAHALDIAADPARLAIITASAVNIVVLMGPSVAASRVAGAESATRKTCQRSVEHPEHLENF